jgi:ankyrin repeat protein
LSKLFNSFGQNLLHISLSEGYFAIMKFLLEQTEININALDFQGNTPIALFLKTEIKLKFFKTEIEISISKITVLEYIFDTYNCDINFFQTNFYGENFLHLASSSGNLEIIQFLLSNINFDINQKDLNGNTPLMHAIISNQVTEEIKLSIIQYLIEIHKANVDLCNKAKMSPLILSMGYQYFTIFNYISQHTKNSSTLVKHGNLLKHISKIEFISPNFKTKILSFLFHKEKNLMSKKQNKSSK